MAASPPAEPRPQDYRANRYHQPSDEYDPELGLGRARSATSRSSTRSAASWPTSERLAELVSGRRIPRHPRPSCAAGGHAMTARQPPEWAPHECVWIGFPSHADLWEDDLEPAREEVAAFARAVHADGKGEEVRLVAADPDIGRGGARAGAVRDRSSSRSRSATSGCATPARSSSRTDGRRLARSFRFNGWGGKYELEGDDTLGAAARRDDRPARPSSSDWILEGGAIDVDGTGLAVTTEQCLLNPNRNPGMTRAEIEARLRDDLGIERVLWLGDGLLNDHTDGHVDNLARFVARGHAGDPGAGEPRRSQCRRSMPTRARAPRRSGSRWSPVPSPGRVERDGEIVAGLLHELLHRQCGGGGAALRRRRTTTRRWRRSARCFPAARRSACAPIMC